MNNLTLNKHGFYVTSQPLRFRTQKECQDYQTGKIGVDLLPKPGTKEYDDAPFEQGFILNTNAA